jgi:hypothetical protein
MFDISYVQRELGRLPESGMGYQLVEVEFEKFPRTDAGIAYNGELLVLSTDPVVNLTRESFDRLVLRAASGRGEIKSLRILHKSDAHRLDARARESLGLKSLSARSGAGPASDAPIEQTRAGEVFKRFTAYAKDFRLREDGGWTDGTYATTEEDAKNVKTGRDAVSRYALPNSEPASHVWTGRPHAGTNLQRGTTQPAFGQPGGGVEVIFTNGTQSQTVTGPVKIPD